MTTAWDTVRVRAQLKLTAQRLGQIQDKIDSQGQITRKDIASLLHQRNIAIARAKAQKLARDDVYGDLLQTLEMHVGTLLEHLGEFERRDPPTPVVVEAASSIIYAAPHTDSRDLQLVRDILAQRLGPDFARSAAGNQDNYVSARVLRDLSAHPPSATSLDRYLYSIAKSHGVHWMPDFQPHEKVDHISAMLDPSSAPVVDMLHLRLLCSHGLPEYPSWLRPRVWRLLLGTLPPQKGSWKEETRKQRDNYYDLVRRLLEPIDGLPTPSTPLSRQDASLVDISKELSHVPHGLFAKLEEEPEPADSCPLDPTAPDGVKIPCAPALDTRLRLIREHESRESPSPADDESLPEIRLESTPEIRLETSDGDENSSTAHVDDDSTTGSYLDAESGGTPDISSAPDSPRSSHSGHPTMLLASRMYSATGAHPKHASALLRLLYVHSSLNPANRSPQIASLLVPLYSALVDEVEPEDAAHLEADAFWLFEAMVGELSELEDVEGGNVWMQKLSERLSWADTELLEDLQTKGLDPALPHYSYRWLTTLLTHILPLPAVLMVWDAVFSQPSRQRDFNPKLEYLVDVCTSMLMCARGRIFNLGRPPRAALNLWGDGTASFVATPLSDHEIEDAFAAGMLLLQNYSVEQIGGPERILQLAYDLAARREADARAAAAAYTMPTAAGLGARFRNTVWRAAAAPPPIPETREDSDDDESEDEDVPLANVNPHRASLSARLAASVWKGITNQSAMEPPPTPMPEAAASPVIQTASAPASAPAMMEKEPDSPTRTRAALWNYAEMFRDSDTAATLAKVSTNWKVKAMDAWSKRSSVASAPASSLSPTWTPAFPRNRNRTSLDSNTSSGSFADKRSSLPNPDGYVSPPRPAFFRPVRDSFIGEPPRQTASPTGSDGSARSDNDTERFRKDALARLGASSRSPSPRSTPKFGPRPLLLNSGSPVVPSRSSTLPANLMDSKFADVVRARRPPGASRGSQSSGSSLSPLDQPGSAGRVHTPDSGSRIVPLNRNASPIARAKRQESLSSAASSPGTNTRRLPESGPEDEVYHKRPERRATSVRDSTTTVESIASPSSPPDFSSRAAVRVVTSEPQRGSVVLNEPDVVAIPFPTGDTPKKSGRKNSVNSLSLIIDNSSDSSVATTTSHVQRTSRVRAKKYPPRLATLRGKEGNRSPHAERAPSPHNLAAPEMKEEVGASTPRASDFDYVPPSPSRRPRKLSGDGRTHKVTEDGFVVRPRKVSTDRKEPKHKRESAAVEGDDEGYDDLLSAYESEDGAAMR